MRLTCPNCGARYEVADSMIPPDGRDVQCSNCTTTWFQPGRRAEVAPAEEPVTQTPAPPPVDAPEPAMHAEAGAEVQQAPPEAPEATLQAEVEPPAAEEAPAEVKPPADIEPPVEAPSPAVMEPPPAPAAPVRQELDPAIRDILRQEALREARLRQAEVDLVETQSEMPLDPAPPRQMAARARPELDAAVDAFDVDKPGAGRAVAARDLFPDIDQINSTLRDSADRSAQEADASDVATLEAIPRRRRGVRIGFVLALTLAVGAVALYGNADLVADRLPAVAAPLAGFVGAVDDARFWLDDLARSIVSAAQ